MEYDSIRRELRIDASPEVVYEVVSSPEHVSRWWPDHADFTPVAGAEGTITFGDPGHPEAKVVPITVLEADPPRLFSFLWVHDGPPSPVNALTVTFELVPAGDGTLLRFTEAGFRDKWTGPELQEAYLDHTRGWDLFLPRLSPYAGELAAAR